jgi:hypothetical protein
MENKEYFMWLRDDDQRMEDCYAAYIIRVYGKEDRDLVWDLFKSGWANEFFEDENIKKKYVIFENYFLEKLKAEYNLEPELINHDTMAFYGGE